MKILLIVETVNDIFIYHYSKWLKNSMKYICLDVYEYHPNNRISCYDENSYENVFSKPSNAHALMNIKGIRGILDPFYVRYDLYNSLKERNYDIIHCHNITPGIAISGFLKDHSRKLIFTFWGGELSHQKLLMNKKLYMFYLEKALKKCDTVANSKVFCKKLVQSYPFLINKTRVANLGSAPLEELNRLMECETPIVSKSKLDIPKDKLALLIGYSGKSIHRHLEIIRELTKRAKELSQDIHLVAAMTRGANEKYIEEVHLALKVSGYTYTIFGNGYMSDLEVARLRNAIDVVFQLSLWDGFSRSIIECMAAKSIVIYGDWLDYETKLSEEKLEAIPVKSIDEGVSFLIGLKGRINDLIPMLESNSSNVIASKLWSNCILDWRTIYQERIS